MANRLRRQDAYGESLPTKKALTVNPSDFQIGGLIGLFERKFKLVYKTNNYSEAQEIFGENINPLWYGWDAVKGFWDNVVGTDSTLYIKSHVGYTGSAYDGVSALATLYDGYAGAASAGYQTIANTGAIGTFASAVVPAIGAASYTLGINVDGSAHALTGIALTAVMTWAQIAAEIQTILRVATSSSETVAISGGKFLVTSFTTGTGSSISITAGGAGGGGDLLAAISGLSGYTATVDAAVAGAPSNATLRLNSGYKTDLDYSDSGNRTGYTITNGARFSTTCKTTGAAADTFVILTSIAGVIVGDIMKFVATGTGGATVYKKITSVDYATGKVNFTGAFHGTANAVSTDVCTVMGFRIRTWRKSYNGTVNEVDADLGAIYCTMASDVSDYYFVNIFSQSKWLCVTDLLSASAVGLNFPADVSSVTYLASGADGTAPSTYLHYGINNATFDNLPIRFLANCETTVKATQDSLETYCRARWDMPKVIYNVASSQTKSQLITLGNSYQRADDVLGIIQEKWYKVADPFSTSAYAQPRNVPSVGHAMGVWIRAIGTLGIHWSAATVNTPVYGIVGVVGTEFSDAGDRTDLAEAGINTTVYESGSGYIIKTFYTPSTTKEYMFAHGILMREYIKVSVREAQLITLNEPNNFARIQSAADAISNFYLRLWDVGSTGNTPEGETFGQSINSDGTKTQFKDHVYVQADLINNPQTSIDLGNRNLDSWFTYPAAAASIKIGVGLMLR